MFRVLRSGDSSLRLRRVQNAGYDLRTLQEIQITLFVSALEHFSFVNTLRTPLGVIVQPLFKSVDCRLWTVDCISYITSKPKPYEKAFPAFTPFHFHLIIFTIEDYWLYERIGRQ